MHWLSPKRLSGVYAPLQTTCQRPLNSSNTSDGRVAPDFSLFSAARMTASTTSSTSGALGSAASAEHSGPDKSAPPATAACNSEGLGSTASSRATARLATCDSAMPAAKLNHGSTRVKSSNFCARVLSSFSPSPWPPPLASVATTPEARRPTTCALPNPWRFDQWQLPAEEATARLPRCRWRATTRAATNEPKVPPTRLPMDARPREDGLPAAPTII
mmetsp:Transcript_23382/g.66153  ORF Transcript_23382/g.66153 Transcript_23382/m.66153 type:complete len:217 (+) Transcript_23382:657-1307(+)